MTINEQKEELVKELGNLKIHQSCAGRDELGKYASKEQLGDIADFIIADRKRIVEPLINIKERNHKNWGLMTSDITINETLKLAGIEESNDKA